MITRLAALAALLAALAGCGSTVAGSSTPAAPANPVAVIRQAGAHTTAMAGDRDIYGDRYASGTLPGGQDVTVYTYAAPGDQARGAQDNPPTDEQAVIRGNLFLLFLSPVYNTDPESPEWMKPSWPVTPQAVAARVHGTVSPS